MVKHFSLKFRRSRFFPLVGFPQIKFQLIFVIFVVLSSIHLRSEFLSVVLVPTARCPFRCWNWNLVHLRRHSSIVVRIFVFQCVFGVLFDGLLVPHGLHRNEVDFRLLLVVNIRVLDLQEGGPEVGELGVASAAF